MKEVPITELIKDRGRQSVADAIGCHYSNLTQVIKKGRCVFAVLDDDGDLVRCYEITPFPKKEMARTNSRT